MTMFRQEGEAGKISLLDLTENLKTCGSHALKAELALSLILLTINYKRTSCCIEEYQKLAIKTMNSLGNCSEVTNQVRRRVMFS